MQDRVPLYPGRVKMTPVAGQANTYDMVRADDPTQAGTPLNKASLLKDATAALYGLTSSAVPDDIFAAIGKYKQYWWRRRLSPLETNVSTEELTNYVFVTFPGTSSSSLISFSVADAVESYAEDITARLRLITPTNETAAPTSMSGFKNKIGGKYATFDTGVTYFFPSDVTLTRDSKNAIADRLTKVTPVIADNPGNSWEYLFSSNRSAYPGSGTQDGYEYEYLGVPFDNVVTAPKIEIGSYTGTGTYGADNPNTLTFGFAPKLVIVRGANPTIFVRGITSGVTWSERCGGGYYDCEFDGNTIRWWLNSSASWSADSISSGSYTAEKQLNTSGNTYHYFAIG